MLIDTHCHINTMVKKEFDIPLSSELLPMAQAIVQEAVANQVTTIINVGTSLIESRNCVKLAQYLPHVFATVGIHPNDATSSWYDDFKEIKKLAFDKEQNKIVGIGECGLDMHYPDYNLIRQKDAFKAQIELALEYDLALVVHTRDAADETLRCLEEYKTQLKRTVIHCFSENLFFANTCIEWGFMLGMGGTITYPKNLVLRDIVATMNLNYLVLETDAPFLPIQSMRGKQNNPKFIKDIALYIAQLREDTFQTIADQTTKNARHLFNLPSALI